MDDNDFVIMDALFAEVKRLNADLQEEDAKEAPEGDETMETKELIQALRADAEWAHANEWETPITLGDHLDAAADALETAGKAQRWVPCSERLPEKDGFYNVVMNGGVWGEPDVWSATSCGFYDGMWDEDGTTITYWMPLPEAPKESAHADS